MFDRLGAVENRYEQIAVELTRPETVNDAALYTKLVKEYREIEPIVQKYRAYQAEQKTVKEALSLLETAGIDQELKELAEEELAESKRKVALYAEELKLLLLPKDPNDTKNVIVEIRAGAGG